MLFNNKLKISLHLKKQQDILFDNILDIW